MAWPGPGNVRTSPGIGRISAAAGIVYVSFEIGNALLERRRCSGSRRRRLCRQKRGIDQKRTKNKNANNHVDPAAALIEPRRPGSTRKTPPNGLVRMPGGVSLPYDSNLNEGVIDRFARGLGANLIHGLNIGI